MAGRSLSRLRRARIEHAGNGDSGGSAVGNEAPRNTGSDSVASEPVAASPDDLFNGGSEPSIAKPAQSGRGGWPKGKPRGNGSSRASDKTRPQLAVSGWQKGLETSFNILARWSGVEKLALLPDESKLLAESISEVNRYYKIPVMKPEHVALCALAGAVASVGKTKIVAVVEHKAKQAARKNAAPKPEQPKPSQTPVYTAAQPNGDNSWLPEFTSDGIH